MRRLVVLACLCAWVLTGCSKADKKADKAPLPKKTAHRDPAGGSAPPPEAYPGTPWEDGKTQATRLRVFYGTDRKATGSIEPNKFFGSDRGHVQFGFCDVSIPKTHKTGELEQPKLWKLEVRENPDKHVMVVGVETADGDRFLNELKRTVEASDERDAFIFVHGYNVTFKDAARRTAQIAYDLKFHGAPIFFSWPAKGDFEDYTVDEGNAEWAEGHVTEFIEAVALASGAKRMHLIAHSMGNRVVTKALERMARKPSFGAVPEFNQVILTAPDIDAEVFKRDLAPRICNNAQRVTIYASSNDRALQASRFVHGSARLGQAGQYLTVFPELPKIEVIDASDVDTSLFGHSYFASTETVLGDIKLLLSGRPPLDRGLKRAQNGAWSLFRTGRMAGGGDETRH
jgi:esterase/lipase superfamily enzyme